MARRQHDLPAAAATGRTFGPILLDLPQVFREDRPDTVRA